MLLALREVGLELGIKELPKEGLASVQAAHPMPNPEEPSASGRARVLAPSVLDHAPVTKS